MAASYPINCIGFASALDYIDDLRMDRAIDGTGRARAFFTQPKQVWRVIHPYLTEAERATLWQFYLTNRRLPIQFQPLKDSPPISAIIVGPPTIRLAGYRVYSAELDVAQFP
jgi:hypothetical protein